jgi:hypothetical protein
MTQIQRLLDAPYIQLRIPAETIQLGNLFLCVLIRVRQCCDHVDRLGASSRYGDVKGPFVNKLPKLFGLPRLNLIIPITVECVAFDFDVGHFGVANLAALGIVVLIHTTVDFQTFRGTS